MEGRPRRGTQAAVGGETALSRLLLNTTFLIDAERQAGELEACIADDDVAIAAVTLAELLVGVALASPRHRPARQAFVDEIVDAIPVLSYDTAVAEAHAALLTATRQAGRPRGAHDLIIAATARATGKTVLTADSTGCADLANVEIVVPDRREPLAAVGRGAD